MVPYLLCPLIAIPNIFTISRADWSMMQIGLDPSYPYLGYIDLETIRIPLPPLSEQRRIVEILQEAEEIRRLRAEAEAKTAELIPAIFNDAVCRSVRHQTCTEVT